MEVAKQKNGMEVRGLHKNSGDYDGLRDVSWTTQEASPEAMQSQCKYGRGSMDGNSRCR